MNNYCRNHYTNHDQPTPPTTQTSKAGGNSVEHQVLWWSQHRGNAQHTFRTWKLSPAAPMVLQPIGCGRVGHRHNTPKQERPETGRFLAAPSIHTPRPRHRGPTHTHPQFDPPTPRDTPHQRTNVAHICPRDMGCLIHDSFCTSARVASPQR